MTFEMTLPKLIMRVIHNLDAINSGLYAEKLVGDQHEEYLTRTPEGQEQVDEHISYSQYPEANILGVIAHLRDRYIFQMVQS
jgi:hypothetical protein